MPSSQMGKLGPKIAPTQQGTLSRAPNPSARCLPRCLRAGPVRREAPAGPLGEDRGTRLEAAPGSAGPGREQESQALKPHQRPGGQELARVPEASEAVPVPTLLRGLQLGMGREGPGSFSGQCG